MDKNTIINIGGVGYVLNCTTEEFFANVVHGASYLVSVNLVKPYNS